MNITVVTTEWVEPAVMDLDRRLRDLASSSDIERCVRLTGPYMKLLRDMIVDYDKREVATRLCREHLTAIETNDSGNAFNMFLLGENVDWQIVLLLRDSTEDVDVHERILRLALEANRAYVACDEFTFLYADQPPIGVLKRYLEVFAKNGVGTGGYGVEPFPKRVKAEARKYGLPHSEWQWLKALIERIDKDFHTPDW